ncbi:MAG: Rieske 2Fe-2S domain-containing protein [Synechococcaceae cyanobacterium RL_1_2]|nr:Rieske 2Fe-2S domain-containing protein [Synechococcaceae cyanobacterium RL_1_2]
MNRRDFIGWAGLGAIISSLPVAIAACSDTTTTTEPETPPPPPETQSSPETTSMESVDSTPREDGFAAIGKVSELDAAGFIGKKDFLGQQVIVIRDPADAAALVAVNALCPHEGCAVDWKGDASEFVCPCHAAKFDPTGAVIEGPAKEALPIYEAKVEEDLVLVKVS